MKKQTSGTIFVYGTLSFDEVISALLGRILKGTLGSITGFKRIRIKNKTYPGLVAANSESSVTGMVHTGITPEELELLDTFEDDFYQKFKTEIKLESGDKIQALVYIIPKSNMQFATTEEWNHDGFGKNYLSDYIEMVARFRREYLAGNRKPQEF
jgi:gamma-glutamylcyclotransferase (GGCT)/AIG2-like uncharacterized protein YtfP